MKGKLLGILWILMFLMATVVSGTGVELTSSSPAEIHVYPGQSIQEAINAANPGDTIIVHEGTYAEQIIIDKELTIEGQGDTTIIKPSAADSFTLFSRKAGGSDNTAAIVVVNANATIKNLKIDGSEIGSVPSGATMFVGILYRGVNGTIDSVTVDNINISSGIGSNAIYLSSMNKEVNVEVKGCTISNFYKNGITANYEGLTVNIHDNNIIGSGPRADVAQNGIQVGFGATGSVMKNTVSNIAYTGEDYEAVGILFVDSNGTAIDNTVTNCQAGIVAQAGWYPPVTCNVIIENNTIDATDLTGLSYIVGTGAVTWDDDAAINVTIKNNDLTGAGYGEGVSIGSEWATGTVNAIIKGNDISNWGDGVWIGPTSNEIKINFNNIEGNVEYGVYNGITVTVDARFNWWGDASGPSGMGLGAGDAISENVTYSPWLGYPYGTVPMTYHVDPTGKIQDAINAASPGDTIKVHEGTYTEQLIINKSLTLIGDPMPKIVAPDTRATFTIPESSATFDPIIFAYGSLTGTETISVTIEGFEIDGGNKAASGYRFVGILYRNVKPGVISNNVLHSLYPPSGKGSGPETVGILIYGDSEVEIYQNEIRDFSRVGIGASGDAGPNVDPVVIIQENTVFGNGLEPETDWWAENGIQVGYGASGEVIGNQVFNCTVNNPNWAASGIIIVDTHEVTVDSNYVEGCDVGINAVDFPSAYGHPWDYDILSNVLITRNVLVGNIWQIDVSNDARNVTITYNNIINAIEDGIDIWSYFGDVYPTDVKIHYNNIEGSGSYGIWASEELAAQPVDARFNWWGSATGPYHPTLNDYGEGDNVSDNVDFWNWLIIPYPPAIASPVPPVASFTYTPFTPIVNEYVTFDASGSYSIDGYITTYVWDFGDGNLTETSNPIIMHKFDSAGTYSVNLTVIDNLGATRSYVKDVIVYPPPPTNVKISPYESSVCIGQEFTINIVIENVSDLAGFELKLFWNTTLADLEDVDIFPPWSDYFLVKNETQEDIGDGRGMFWLALIMLPPSEPFNGTTVLATLTFNATNIGTSILDLDQVKLGDSLANPIPTNIVDGYIESHIAIPGDVDGNGHVDIYDLIIWAGAFGTFAGEPDFNPAADLNNDGVIDIYDGIIIAINYGA